MASLAPIPSASVRTTVTVSPFARDSERIANGAAIVHPFLRHRKPPWFEAASADPPDLFGLYQAAFLQHLQVLNYRGQTNVEGLRQPRDRYGALAELLHDCPSSRIAEGV